MPETTSNLALPYPTGADPVRDAPETIEAALKTLDQWAGDPYIVIDGKKYPQAGAMGNPKNFKAIQYQAVYAGTITLTMPYTPPPGWTFDVYPLSSSGFTILQASGISGNKLSVRWIQIGNNDIAALTQIGWRLVPALTNPNRLNQTDTTEETA